MPNTTKSQTNSASSAGVHAAYGDPVDMNGTTIVPVAVASYGFAGSKAVSEEGATAPTSGGGVACPIGAYVTRDGYTRFEPNIIALLTVGIPFICVTGRALTRLVKALKK